MTGRSLSSMVAYPFVVPFSALSAPNGLSTPDSECTRGEQQSDEGGDDNGGMHGGGDEDEEERDAREEGPMAVGQGREVRGQRLRRPPSAPPLARPWCVRTMRRACRSVAEALVDVLHTHTVAQGESEGERPEGEKTTSRSAEKREKIKCACQLPECDGGLQGTRGDSNGLQNTTIRRLTGRRE
jgi:hypothetical protein